MDRHELAQLVKEGMMPLIETGIVHPDFVNPIIYRIADRVIAAYEKRDTEANDE